MNIGKIEQLTTEEDSTRINLHRRTPEEQEIYWRSKITTCLVRLDEVEGKLDKLEELIKKRYGTRIVNE